MRKEDLNKLLVKYKGWWDCDIARFPSVYLRQEFEREYGAELDAKSLP